MKKRIHKITPLNSAAAAYSNDHAAEYIGVSPNSMKISRRTGELCCQPAPSYKKMERKVIYLHSVLDQWLDELPGYKNTAQAGQ
jgi:hypothetical protein